MPPSSRVAAIPEEAVDNAIPSSAQIFANTKLIKKVFPVPPNPSRKKTPPAPDAITPQSASKATL